jgi:cytochrome c oxidase subunit 2
LAQLPLLAGCGTELPVPVDAVNVRLLAQDRSWHASYEMADAVGRTIDVPTGREVHVPLGARVHLTLNSPEFIGAFTVPDLELRHFAAPGLPSQVNFVADRVGAHELRGDEMCGRPHTERSRGWLVIDSPSAFQQWVRRQAREARR